MQDISTTTASTNYLKADGDTGAVFSITSQQQQIHYMRKQKPDHEKTREELIEEINHLRAVSNSNKNARIMLDEMYQFVALLDVNGNLLDVNEPALQGGGMIRSSIQGIPFWDCSRWATSQENIDNVREAVHKASKGEFIRYETEIFCKSAGTEKITIDFSLMPLFNDKGEVSLILPEGRNITEKRLGELEIERKNNELRSLYEKIKELDELKTQFFANVSHELRTPLALIVGPTDKLLKDENVDINVRKDLEIVARNARGLLKIVNNLLDISRLEAGKMNLNYSMVNLGQTAHLIASCFEILAREKSLDFSIITPSEPMMAAIDADKMQRVITNLISNAFKFTPSGGAGKCILEKFDLSPNKPGFQIVVSDTGPGIPDNLHEIIFERFRQVDGSSTRKHGGTGLGLSIVKEFVTLHGGTVTIHNISTGGAQFTLRLPLTPNMDEHLYKKTISDQNISEIQQQLYQQQQQEQQQQQQQQNLQQPKLILNNIDNKYKINDDDNDDDDDDDDEDGLNFNILRKTNTSSDIASNALKDNMGSIMGVHAIAQQAVEELTEKQFYQSQENIHNKPIVLVVEDNPEMNRFIAELLSKYYFVVTAFDGVEGIEKTRAITPDLIVTDCMMPRMSGDEMVEQLRSDEQFDNIPILLLTAKADENLRIKLLQNGVSDYVNKPFSSEELVARVVNLMTMKKAKQFLQEELSSAKYRSSRIN
nr:hybrid histidine kinase [Dictyostelium discoideum]